MPPIRVLIVDDSALIRRMLSDVLASDSEIEVVGTAANGALALAEVLKDKPDVITLDVEMPEMGGLEALVAIHRLDPRLPVIMFSAFTERGAATTLEALARGASDYVCKPAQAGSLEHAMTCMREELIPKIKALSAVCRVVLPAAPAPAPLVLARPLPRVDVLAIGASTGGPPALTELLTQLPANFPVPIVIVQHMPPLFTRLLAERLDLQSPMVVREAKQGSRIEAGQVCIAPGDRHMAVVRRGSDVVLTLSNGPPENSCRPAVDVLFRSVAQACGPASLALVLTGMGSDGTRGARLIREAGGQVVAQDKASSVVWGMPGSVVAANLADCVCPLATLALEVQRRVAIRRSSCIGAPLRTGRHGLPVLRN